MVPSKKRKKTIEEKPPVIADLVTEILPHSHYDEEHGFFINQDETCIALVQVRAKDLANENDYDLEYDCLKWTKLYRTYADDVKIIAMNFPCNTSENQSYFEHKLNNTNNEVFKYWLERSRRECEFLEENNTAREYYLMLFADDVEQMIKLRRIVEVELTGGECLVERISQTKQEQVMYKMNNMSCLIR